MRSTRCLSSDRCSYLWSSILPSRPELTAVTLSRRTQRHSYADAPDRASKCSGLLSPIAGILAAALLFTSPLAGFFCLASKSSAQNLSRAESIDRLAKIIEEASDRFAVQARWIRAVIQIESGGDEHAISPRGAMGLMQLMPGSWVELGVRYGLGIQQQVGPCGNRVWLHTGGVPGYTSVAVADDTGKRTGVLLIPSEVEPEARHAATQRLLDAILCAMDDKPAPGHG